MLVDSSLVSKVPEGVTHLYPIPVTDIAEFKLGRKVVANMVMLGALSAITGIVSREGLEAAVRSTVPGKTIDLNLKALEEGYQEGTRLAAS